jgi:hypothetical protein
MPLTWSHIICRRSHIGVSKKTTTLDDIYQSHRPPAPPRPPLTHLHLSPHLNLISSEHPKSHPLPSGDCKFPRSSSHPFPWILMHQASSSCSFGTFWDGAHLHPIIFRSLIPSYCLSVVCGLWSSMVYVYMLYIVSHTISYPLLSTHTRRRYIPKVVSFLIYLCANIPMYIW